MRSGALEQLKEDEKFERRRGPSRKSKRERKRRLSDSDLHIPMDMPEVHEIGLNQKTVPRTEFHEVIFFVLYHRLITSVDSIWSNVL